MARSGIGLGRADLAQGILDLGLGDAGVARDGAVHLGDGVADGFVEGSHVLVGDGFVFCLFHGFVLVRSIDKQVYIKTCVM